MVLSQTEIELTSAVQRLAKSGAIEQSIEKSIGDAVKEAVADHFKSYNEGGKAIRVAVTRALAIGEELDLPSYNQTILEIVRRQVEAASRGLIQSQVLHQVEKLLEPAPAEIALSKLVKMFVDQAKDHASGACVCHGEARVTLFVEQSDYGWVDVYLDEKSDTKMRECDIHFSVSKKTGELRLIWFRNQDVDKQLFAAHQLYGFERALFQMRATGTKLVFDVDSEEIETSYSLHEH